MTPLPFCPEGLRAYRLFESDDLDETRECISRVMQPHALLPSGKRGGRSHMDFVKLGKLGLGTIAFGHAMRVDVEAVDGYHLMMFCVNGHAEVRTAHRSVHVDRNNGILCAPGQPFDAMLSPDCEQFVLRIDPATLSAHTGTRRRALDPHVHLDSAQLRGWQQQLQLIAGSPELLACARDNPRVALHLERLLVELLAQGHATNDDLGKQRRIAPGFVKRAEEFIEASSAEPLRLMDIAHAVGLSERTLRDGFQQFRGTSPMQYLRQVRLERARAALSAGTPGLRIAEVALACGFTHLGRFALEYKQQFGASPSETLKSR